MLVGVTATLIGTGAAVMVSVAVAVLDVSATDVAVSVTVAGDGTAAGAVYVIATPEALDVADSVPQDTPVHPAPAIFHVTPLFWSSFWSVAAMF
jgi:hypothetical protein